MAVSENADAAAMFWEVGAPPIIAVIRASTDDASRVAAAVETLAGAGIRSIELTLTTPKALELVAPLKQRLGPAVKVGMGTLWSEDDAASAAAAGAVSLGSDLMRDGLSVGGLDGLARRAREAVAQAGGAT